MQKENGNNWFVLQSRSRHEKKVLAFLTAQEIEAYLPLHTVKKKWSDRIKLVEEPLFPGYLFVKYDEINRYKILNTPGAVRFVSFEGKYASIPEKQIAAIKIIAAKEEETEVIDLSFIVGEEVFISDGPFKGLYAKLVDYKGKSKFVLEVEAIGKGVLLEIGTTKVTKV
jgi:transcriptional antiterminator RfaH